MSAPKLRVLLTGAAGHIATSLLPSFRERYELRAFDRRPVAGVPDALTGDLGDREVLARAVAGIEVVVHLAANPNNRATYGEVLGPNISGVYNLFEAACAAHVRRLVFASSCHAIMGFAHERRTVDVADGPRPKDLYGVSKVFGEALGSYYHHAHGMEFVAVRIGAFQPRGRHGLEPGGWLRSLWLSPDDAVRLFHCAVEKPGVGYAIVFGTSRTAPEFMSLRPARELLGYEPQDGVL